MRLSRSRPLETFWRVRRIEGYVAEIALKDGMNAVEQLLNVIS
jgi:hypothetical protein